MRRQETRSGFVFGPAIALIGLLLATSLQRVSATEIGDLRFDPALMRSPPEVAEASIQVLLAPIPEGNARLRVRFKDKVAQQALVIQGGAGPTLLRDDGLGADESAGDGVFSAYVNFDAQEYHAGLKRRAALKIREVPVFKNRILIARKKPEIPRVIPFTPGDTIPIFPSDDDPSTVDPARELMITDLSVVEDPARTYDPCTGAGTPMGPWTFGKLMTDLANEPATGINPSDFTLHWLQHWNTDLTINSFTVFDRSFGLNDQILNPWPRLPDGRLDLSRAPFRLLAIVNRIDLRGSTAYGASDAGEARFVFGLLRCNPPPPQREVKEFTVILEYSIKKSSCWGVRHWARQWHALGSLALGSTEYNAALQAVTDQFARRNTDPSKRPNRSAFNQLRTNEFAIADFPAGAFWELREFALCGDASACALGGLEETTIAQTPDTSFQFQSDLGTYINDNESAILAGTHTVPLQLPPSTPFRGGVVQPGAGFSWQSSVIANPEARHAFGIATCNGCHTMETGTRFLQIAPRAAGSPSVLSDFLTGLNQPKNDPVSGVPRTFNDLLDRQTRLDATVNMSCQPHTLPVEEMFTRFVPPAFAH